MRPNGRRDSRGFTIAEVLIGIVLFSLLVGLLVRIFGFSNQAMSRLSSQMALQQASRKAVVRLVQELQESMEVLTPIPGSTLSYALVRDKTALIRWYYQVPQADSPGAFELWRFLKDPRLPPARQAERMLSNVRRLTFTSRSEGALTMNLVVADQTREYSILSTVRLRNLASAEELW